MVKIADYIILKKIATGGMAEVFLAKSTLTKSIEKLFAIKCLLPKFLCEKSYVDLFTNEATVQVNMNHSNVVSIYDFGVSNAKFFILMEYVNGCTLRSLFRNCIKSKDELSFQEIIYIIKESAQGLDHAHSCCDIQTNEKIEIIHGDISPDNIMISTYGEVKIIDFGVSKFVDVDRELIAGKKKYMSKRQASGEKLNFKSDIYSLGRTFLELVRSSLGFERFLDRENHISDLEEIKDAVDKDIYKFLERMLKFEKDDSYYCMSLLANDLSIYLNTNYPSFNKQTLGEKLKNYNSKDVPDYDESDQTEATITQYHSNEIDFSKLYVDCGKTGSKKTTSKRTRARRRTYKKKVS